MFWWNDEEEKIFVTASGISVAVIETNDGAVYRLVPRQDTLKPCRTDATPSQQESIEV